MSALVSVIIPTYNAGQHLAETLTSVLNQTYNKLEIIIIDDGSEDNTPEIVNDFKEEVIFYQQANGGACKARNKGFELSSGNFIQFLDADDLLSLNKIEDQIMELEQNPNFIANGRWGRFFTENPYAEDIQWGPHYSLQKDLYPVEWLSQNHMSQTACWLTPRHLVEAAGPWDESLTQNQDGEFFTRVVAKAAKVLYTPNSRVYYRSNQAGTVSKNAQKRDNIESRYKTCESFESVILSLEDSPRTRLAIANKYQQFVYGAFPFHRDAVAHAERKIQQYGGSSLETFHRGKLRFLNKLLGWKTVARLLQSLKT